MEELVILFRRYCSLLLILAALALVSCTPPLMESARIHKGLSYGGGIGFAVINNQGALYGDDMYEEVRDLGYAVFSRYGFNERYSLGLQASMVGKDIDYGNILLNLKLGLDKQNACMLSLGWPRVACFYFLRDGGDLITYRFGCSWIYVGLGAALSVDGALDLHPNISKRFRLHITGNGGWSAGEGYEDGYSITSYSVGIGIEFLPVLR